MPSNGVPLPWKKMILVALFVFLTGFAYLVQEYASYFLGSLIGIEKTVLEEYPCPQASFPFEVSPIPGLFAYQKGNTEFNRYEILKLNEKNYGLTAWFSYDKSFQEAEKIKLIDQIAYERNPHQYLVNLYNALRNDQSIHAAADFVTKWISQDNPNLPTVFPYSAGYVVEATTGNIGYGNYVSVCSDLSDNQKTLRVLYSVAHLSSITVQQGQIIKAGDELGKIGSTGKSTTIHAHITIMPDLIWVPNYREVYNAGYKFYYPNTVAEALVKTIDPISVILNPDIAYSIALDDSKRKAVFENADQYVASLGNTLAFTGANIALNPLPLPDIQPQKVFSGLRVTTLQERVNTNDPVSVIIEALDQNSVLFPFVNQNIDVVLSSSTATGGGTKTLQNGQSIFQITDSNPGEVIIQVGNQGSFSAEKKVFFAELPRPTLSSTVSTPSSNQQPVTSTQPVTSQPANQKHVSLIKILPGDNYWAHDRNGDILIVFNDQNIKDEYPIGIKFAVPEGTDAVSVFSGLTSRVFPDSGEFKLSKYQKGQAFVSYYPKYQLEDSYKKIVAYSEGTPFDELVLTFSSASKYVFTDVVPGITDADLVDAIEALKEAKVVKGNPDGSFGIIKPLNRASAVTLLIRTFYSDVNLDELKITKMKFKDVLKTAWYAPAIWFASEREYNGEEKPIIMKGTNGKALPDNPVKIEEFLMMTLRVLEFDRSLRRTRPWYESTIKKSIELGLITEQERSLINKPLTRGIVAKIIVQALKVAESK